MVTATVWSFTVLAPRRRKIAMNFFGKPRMRCDLIAAAGPRVYPSVLSSFTAFMLLGVKFFVLEFGSIVVVVVQ